MVPPHIAFTGSIKKCHAASVYIWIKTKFAFSHLNLSRDIHDCVTERELFIMLFGFRQYLYVYIYVSVYLYLPSEIIARDRAE